MIELVQVPQQQPLDDDAEDADQQWRHYQHHPVVEPKVGQAHPREHRAHHVERAVRKIDDVQQSENHGQTE